MQSVLGIDLGTQSLKALFYDPSDRRVLASASAPLDLLADDNGKREQHAMWWITALEHAMSSVPLSVRKSVKAMAVSGQQHGFTPLAKDGSVLHPVKLWSDTSTLAECDTLTTAFGGRDACLRKLGNPILPGYTLPKILWLKRHHPDLYAQLDCVLLPHDFLNFYLTGKKAMEYGDASGTGALEIENRRWNEDILRCLDPDRNLLALFPHLIAADTPLGTVLPHIADHLGLPADVLVASGGGDNMMGAIGTGNTRPGQMTLSLGTSGTLYAYSDHPIVDQQHGEVAAFCSSTNGWLPLICSLNCANGKDLWQNLLGTHQHHEAEALAQQALPGSQGLLTVPFFNGERSPFLPDARGLLLGMTESNVTSANLMRSALEGATYTLKLGEERLASLGIKTDQIRVTGGGANSPAWRQLIADVFNKPVLTCNQQHGAAMGAAIQALWAWQGGDLQALVDTHIDPALQAPLIPDALSAEIYREHFSEFKRAVALTRDFYHPNTMHHRRSIA